LLRQCIPEVSLKYIVEYEVIEDYNVKIIRLGDQLLIQIIKNQELRYLPIKKIHSIKKMRMSGCTFKINIVSTIRYPLLMG